VIAEAGIDDDTRADRAQYLGCIDGAAHRRGVRELLGDAGLTEIEITRLTASTSTPPRPSSAPHAH